ncbi:MAG: hypothetical protein PHH28_12270 [Desulfuromonadaceae bacterium]|nr:hypothetical protein [Desulfuromonadaceae bacterium]
MRSTKYLGIKNAILVVLILLGFGSLANMHVKNSVIVGLRSYGISWRIAETPIFSFLPRWFLNRAAIPISRERNADVLKSALEVFNPSLRSFLISVPIILDSSAETAKCYSTKGYIGVNPDWDNTVLQSPFRNIYAQRGMKLEDPVYIKRFKTTLLIHEFLHILQVHQGIESRSFYEAVAQWYVDPRYGIPSPNGVVRVDTTKDRRPDTLAYNRIKYLLWHQLYNYQGLRDVPLDANWKNMQYVERYQSSKRGVEEFAYIGEEILASGSASENYIKTGHWRDEDWKEKKMRLLELSPEVIALFRGVFNPKVLQ